MVLRLRIGGRIILPALTVLTLTVVILVAVTYSRSSTMITDLVYRQATAWPRATRIRCRAGSSA